MEVHFLSWPTMARRKWRAILWGLMEKHCQVWVLYSVKIAFRYGGEGRDISQMKRNTENSFLEKLFWRILKENSIGRKKMIAERGLKFQKEKKNIMIGTHRQKCNKSSYFLWEFLKWIYDDWSKNYKHLLWLSIYVQEILRIIIF